MSSFATLTQMGAPVAEETLGKRLVRARLEYGARLEPPRVVTQLEVGRALDVSGVAVGGWEADRNVPTVENIRALARFYRVRAGWIIAGELPMRDEGATPNTSRPLGLSDPSTSVSLERPARKKRRRGA